MNISEEHKAIFIHIHKSAGGSVGTLLKEIGFASNVHNGTVIPNHTTARNLLKTCPDLSDYQFFTIVRNPWARLVSNYHSVLGFADFPTHHKSYQWFKSYAKKRMSEFDSFEHYVRALYSSYNEIKPLHKVTEIGKPSSSVYKKQGLTVYPGQDHYTGDALGSRIR